MSTDQVALFNKRQCDQILQLSWEDLPAYLSLQVGMFDRMSPFQQGFDANTSISERLSRLLDTGHSQNEVRAMLVEHFCLSPERISLDYWACYPLVFGEDPPGSIPDYDLFPERHHVQFLLLRADHVARMLDTLSILRRKLTVMSDTSVAVLQYWQDRCAKDVNWMVAYLFDR